MAGLITCNYHIVDSKAKAALNRILLWFAFRFSLILGYPLHLGFMLSFKLIIRICFVPCSFKSMGFTQIVLPFIFLLCSYLFKSLAFFAFCGHWLIFDGLYCFILMLLPLFLFPNHFGILRFILLFSCLFH